MARYRVELSIRVIEADVEELEAAVFDRPAGLELAGELVAESNADTAFAAAAETLKAGLDLLPGLE